MSKKTPWTWIIVGIVAFTMIVGVALIAVAGFVVYQQFSVKSTPSTKAHAEIEFQDLERRFAGQQPLLDVARGGTIVNRPDPSARRQPITVLHVVVWNHDEERVVSMNIPFWLIRMTSGHPIKLSAGDDDESSPAQLHLTADDLERHGPGLILRHEKPNGNRVIVWAQ